MVPHLGFIFVLVKLMQTIWKENGFLGEGFPQDQGYELDCERAEVLCEEAETFFSNSSFPSSFPLVGWETVGNGEASLGVCSSQKISKGQWFAECFAARCQACVHVNLFTFKLPNNKQRGREKEKAKKQYLSLPCNEFRKFFFPFASMSFLQGGVSELINFWRRYLMSTVCLQVWNKTTFQSCPLEQMFILFSCEVVGHFFQHIMSNHLTLFTKAK